MLLWPPVAPCGPIAPCDTLWDLDPLLHPLLLEYALNWALYSLVRTGDLPSHPSESLEYPADLALGDPVGPIWLLASLVFLASPVLPCSPVATCTLPSLLLPPSGLLPRTLLLAPVFPRCSCCSVVLPARSVTRAGPVAPVGPRRTSRSS